MGEIVAVIGCGDRNGWGARRKVVACHGRELMM